MDFLLIQKILQKVLIGALLLLFYIQEVVMNN